MPKETTSWKNLTIRIPESLHENFKVLVVKNKDVMKDILVERIHSYIAEKEKTVVY